MVSNRIAFPESAIPVDQSGKTISLSKRRLAKKLGLSGKQVDDLCYPRICWDSVKRAHAVAVMDRLISTGEVSWEGIVE